MNKPRLNLRPDDEPFRADPKQSFTMPARFYTDPAVFAGRDGQGFLLDDTGRVVDARADEETVSLVQRLLASAQGLPLQEVDE